MPAKNIPIKRFLARVAKEGIECHNGTANEDDLQWRCPNKHRWSSSLKMMKRGKCPICYSNHWTKITIH